MSLLDAIGLSAPEETPNRQKPAPARKDKAKTVAPSAAKGTAEEAAAAPPHKDPAPESLETGTAAPESAKPPAPKAAAKSGDNGAHETARAGAETDAVNTPDAVISPNAEADAAASELDTGAPASLEGFLCFALYSANHAMHGVYKGLLKEIGLTYPQFLAMTVLWETNKVPVGAITSRLQLDTNTLTPLLKRLEAMGLLTRTRNAKDERQVILKLTRKGRALQKKTEDFARCIFSATGLTIEEVTDLQAKIITLRDNLRTQDGR